MHGEATFLRVEWLHPDEGDAVVLYSALNADRYEVRKVEVWSDGTGMVSESVDDEGAQPTFLSALQVLTFEELDADEELAVSEITAAEFDAVWDQYR